MNEPSIYSVFNIHLRPDGSTYRQEAGTYYIFDGNLEVVHDPFGLLNKVLGSNGPITHRKVKALQRLENSSYYDVVKEGPNGDIMNGDRPDLIPELELNDPNGGQVEKVTPQAKPPAVWEYLRSGLSTPQILEVYNDKGVLNGLPLSTEELAQIRNNVKEGIATLRYPERPELVVKSMEDPYYERLFKNEEDKYSVSQSDVADAQRSAGHFAKLQQLVQQGMLDPETLQHMRTLAYGDTVTGLGNKLAYKHFLANKKPGGVHVMLDANDFKPINEELGHDQGDKAIAAMGGAIKQALDDTHQSMPVENDSSAGKAHRFGGDEFHVHLPTTDHASLFSRKLAQRLEQIPALGGTHHIGMSLGIGQDPRTADEALDRAKKTLKQPELEQLAGRKLGNGERPFDPVTGRAIRAQGKVYAYSLHPSAPGPVPQPGHAVPPGAIPPPMSARETAPRPNILPPPMPVAPAGATPGQPKAPAPSGATAAPKPTAG